MKQISQNSLAIPLKSYKGGFVTHQQRFASKPAFYGLITGVFTIWKSRCHLLDRFALIKINVNMKNSFCFLIGLSFAWQGAAQTPLFQKIAEGPHVTTPSDSRSVNFVDVNNDGWDDLFISNGPENGAVNLLYLNDGTGKFTSVANDPVVSDSKPFDGASFADFDNDGDLDAFVVTWYGAKNYLYAGNGDGSFTYLGDAAPSQLGTYSETTAWGDYDTDGDLDLYVTNSGGSKKNLLYRNDGGQNFTLITDMGAVVNDANVSRSVNWVDFDLDGDLDLYVSNESNQKDDLYENQNGALVKVETGAPGQTNHSTMSSSWADVDNDGDLDLFLANSLYFAAQNNQLFLQEDGVFTAVTTGDLVTDGGCSYSSNFADYDNDGDLDLAVSNGFCNGNIKNFLYQNDGLGNFTRDLNSIEDLSTPCSYGLAWGDVNNDGFLDLAIATCKSAAASPLPNNLFYLNNGNANNWLKIKLVGETSNRSAIGAKLWVTATIGGQVVTQFREISAQSGHCGQNSLTAHFGLGDAVKVDEVRVKFLGGQDTTYTNIYAGQCLAITENQVATEVEVAEPRPIGIAVVPNPASDSFFIIVKSPQPMHSLRISFADASGREIKLEELKISGNEWQASYSKQALGLHTGMSIVTVEVDGNRKSVLVK
jgi:enediyne biosynthesis protein E4